MNSIDYGDDSPGFVFTNNIDSVKNVALAIAHEFGHTIGLVHDSVGTYGQADYNEYWTGNEKVVSIMGYFFDLPIARFYLGPSNTYWNGYTRVTGQIQDDLAVITSRFGLKDDDAGDARAGAAPMNFDGASFKANAVVSSGADVDFFRFVLPTAGTISGSVVSSIDGFGQLSASAEILNDAGAILLSSDTINPLDSQFCYNSACCWYILCTRERRISLRKCRHCSYHA